MGGPASPPTPTVDGEGTVGRWRWCVRIVATCGLVWWICLLATPSLALKLWWGGLVPLMPGMFLINPRVWRNVCPVAALEVWSGERVGRTLGGASAIRAGGVGTVLFVLIVSGRAPLFDHSGLALALVVALATSVAGVRGRTHAVRAGFCNSICPLGAVERFYGQRALVAVAPAHCPSCTVCTLRGCPDVAGDKAMRQLVGGPGGRVGWLLRPQGAFAGAMPGLILGYAFGGPEATWAAGLTAVTAGCVGSWLTVLAISLVVPEARGRVPPVTAAVSAVLFYQTVGSTSVGVWGLPALSWGVRWLGTVLALVWAVHLRSRFPGAPGRRSAGRSRTRSLPVLVTQPG